MYNLFSNKREFSILGSNTGVQIPKFEGGYFLPDVTIVKGQPTFKSGSTAIITNPRIVIEILSPATSNYDITEKLPDYMRIESLQQIFFVSQKNISVMSYSRSDQPETWLYQNYTKVEDALMVENMPVSLRDIYDKVQFPK